MLKKGPGTTSKYRFLAEDLESGNQAVFVRRYDSRET
jgi:hypothetical protein